jgi:molybdopterin converting factor subunit 1
MRVRVKLFAAARQQVGREVVHVELPDSATVADLRARLAAEFPALQSDASLLLVAVNHQYATDDVLLTADAEIAGFPPVSGG